MHRLWAFHAVHVTVDEPNSSVAYSHAVVLRVEGFTLGFYANEHDPPHVHIRYAGKLVIVDIETANVRRNVGMKPHEMLRAVRLVEEHKDLLLAGWIAFDLKRKRD